MNPRASGGRGSKEFAKSNSGTRQDCEPAVAALKAQIEALEKRLDNTEQKLIDIFAQVTGPLNNEQLRQLKQLRRFFSPGGNS